MNDICVNPSRLDSWAGMALARMSQLEQKLNSVSIFKLKTGKEKLRTGVVRVFFRL